MEQQLFFEQAWERTIAFIDRQEITKRFHEQPINNKRSLQFIKKAYNHKNHLLITVIIHNQTEQALEINHTKVTCMKDDRQVATGTFRLPCNIPAYHSMPWTFIFSDWSPDHF